jgi:hypothetical protein
MCETFPKEATVVRLNSVILTMIYSSTVAHMYGEMRQKETGGLK